MQSTSVGSTARYPAVSGGESQKSFQERCCRAFLESVAALRQAGCASVAYVVHGGTIMALMERFCTEEKSYFDWQVKNQEGFACEIQDAARVTADARFMQLTDRLPLPEERLHKKRHRGCLCGTEK